jgi:pentose-5-phosphate-3-epimerase
MQTYSNLNIPIDVDNNMTIKNIETSRNTSMTIIDAGRLIFRHSDIQIRIVATNSTLYGGH